MSGKDKKEMGFWDHLTELLHRLRTVAYALFISTVAVMVVPISLDLSDMSASNPWYQTISSSVIKKLQADFLPADIELLPISWFAPLEVYLYVSIILGVVISSPVIMYELYNFINPALHQHEMKLIYPFILAFMGLFIFGFSLGYLVIIPATVRAMVMFTRLLGLTPVYGFSDFFSVVMMTLLLSGFIFTFPVYVVLLIKFAIISTEQIKKSRKYIYVGAVVLIALIDPEPSLITEITCIIPFIVLLEASILVGRRFEKQREEAEE
ncbi:MAG: twin-arginine translocase subunit TatC [Candidatus Bathyarchaeota archaeon]|nr:MAG: twin-arginine translocase subunit TatC [Candidatus Bathyarchaeota archaeon]